jgi:hypothetical protein
VVYVVFSCLVLCPSHTVVGEPSKQKMDFYSVAQLNEFAKLYGVSVIDKMTRKELIRKLEAAGMPTEIEGQGKAGFASHAAAASALDQQEYDLHSASKPTQPPPLQSKPPTRGKPPTKPTPTAKTNKESKQAIPEPPRIVRTMPEPRQVTMIRTMPEPRKVGGRRGGEAKQSLAAKPKTSSKPAAPTMELLVDPPTVSAIRKAPRLWTIAKLKQLLIQCNVRLPTGVEVNRRAPYIRHYAEYLAHDS